MNNTTLKTQPRNVSQKKVREMLKLSAKLHEVAADILEERELIAEMDLWEGASRNDTNAFLKQHKL